MSLPRISVLMDVTASTLRLHVSQGQTITVAELRAVANLLHYFAASADQMERRIAGEPAGAIEIGGNVISLAAFAEKLKADTNLKEPS